MKDLMSGNLTRMGSASQSAFRRMAQHANQQVQRNRVVGQSYNEIQRRIRQVESTIASSTIPRQIAAARRELAQLQAQANRHPGNSSGGSSGGGGTSIGGIALGSMIGNIGANIASSFLETVRNGIGAAISGTMQKEKDIVGISTFIGDKDAKQAYQNIRQDASVTPFDTATLLKANRALISVDGNAKNAREDVMNLANAVAGSGGSTDELQRMAINMQQIKSLGVASAVDIKQFGYAGINIYKLLEQSTGKHADEVKKMDITYDMLAKTFAVARMEGGKYPQALEKMSQTMSGKWESLKDRTANSLTDIGDAFAPVITKVLELGIAVTQRVQPFLQSIQPEIQKASAFLSGAIDSAKEFYRWVTGGSTSFAVFATVLGSLTAGLLAYQAVMKVQAIWTGIVTGAQNLLNLAMMMNPVGLVIAAIVALVAAFVIAYKKFEGFRAAVDGTWAAVKVFATNIKNTFVKLPDIVIRAISRIPKAIATAFSGVGDLMGAIFTGKFDKIPGILKKITGAALSANPLTEIVAETTKGVGDAFSKAHTKSLADSKKQKELDKKRPPKEKAPGAYFSDLTRFSDAAAPGDKDKDKNKKKSKSAGDTIAGGGTKYITIHLGKFFDNINFTTMNMKESEADIEKILMEMMGRVLYNGGKNM